ncbi:hypothetical protein [Streptomyces cavernae]|uniref:hypothetical protein n=1 Tax=Streptomyces cavernae TaxID=2259034 RepID=UPI000FEC1087|nr:hypothetical protein [Streptomyces cavernae]
MTATTLNIGIIRAGSPALNINLVPTHLPADVRAAFEHLAKSRSDLADAERALGGVHGDAWHDANTRVETARAAADQAMTDFAALGAASSTAIKDSANAAFNGCIERASGHLQAALDELAEASQAAALFHSVTPGRPVIHTDTRRANEAPVKQAIGMARGYINDARGFVPDSVD